jgi:hypothetical protein
MFKSTNTLSYILQILIFVILYFSFLKYYSSRRGVDYSSSINKSSKLFYDENGVHKNLKSDPQYIFRNI